jgi:hypothetical protein
MTEKIAMKGVPLTLAAPDINQVQWIDYNGYSDSLKQHGFGFPTTIYG